MESLWKFSQNINSVANLCLATRATAYGWRVRPAKIFDNDNGSPWGRGKFPKYKDILRMALLYSLCAINQKHFFQSSVAFQVKRDGVEKNKNSAIKFLFLPRLAGTLIPLLPRLHPETVYLFTSLERKSKDKESSFRSVV